MDSLNPVGMVDQSVAAAAADRLRAFRGALYGCLGRRADELFELTDALLCTEGPVCSLVGLCLAPEHRRGHGALYDAINVGQVDVERLREVLACLPLSRMFGGRIVLAVDATPWLRPDAETSPERLFCHVYGRTRETDQLLPGWPYQLVAALESGPTSWTARYGRAQALCWDRMHPRLTHRGAWAAHPGRLPIVEGTLIRLAVEHLPGARAAKPVWLWTSALGADAAAVTRCWQAYLRRFDLEHTIRFEKQALGWTRPRLRSPAAADRWTWLIIAAHTQLRLGRSLAVDLRRPWERPLPPERLTPARVRRGFRYLRRKTSAPASAPKPAHPGPGRPLGSRNRHRAPRYDVGKTVTKAAGTSR